MKTYSFKTYGTDETELLGKRLASALTKAKIKRAFIAMLGEMGVGKTAFTRGFASQLGIKNVKSPTYALLNEYRGEVSVYHFDMYRVESEDDLLSIGYDDYIEREGYVVCEWSENIEASLPKECIFVSISRSDEGEAVRNIEILSRGVELALEEGVTA